MMGNEQLVADLEAKGFKREWMGGNIEALVRHRNGKTEVVTACEGHLPYDDDWMLCVYEGDWLSDPDADEIDLIDHESSPMHLLQVVDL